MTRPAPLGDTGTGGQGDRVGHARSLVHRRGRRRYTLVHRQGRRRYLLLALCVAAGFAAAPTPPSVGPASLPASSVGPASLPAGAQQRAQSVDKLRVETHRAAAPAARDVEVRTSLSRTALWVGDHVVYEIELQCAPGFDVLPQDLAKDKVKVEGLEILDVETVREIHGEALTHRARYRLTPTAVSSDTLSVGPVTVRYFKRRPGQPDSAPTGEVQVAASTIALRSTLPASQDALAIRDTRRFEPLPPAYAWLRTIGWTLVLVSFAPLAFVLVNAARRWHQPDARRRARRTRASSRVQLEDVKGLDVTKDDDRRLAFDRLDGVVRTHLAGLTGLTAPALAPAELERELQRRHAAFPAVDIKTLLETCQAARYGRANDVPSRAAWDDALQIAERVVAISPR